MASTYPLAYLAPYWEHGLNYLVDRYAQIMREVAHEREAPLMDFHRAFSRNPATERFLPDGIHPTVEGHGFLARIYIRRLREILPSIPPEAPSAA